MKSYFGTFRCINYYSITCTFKNVWSWWTLPESSSKLDKLCLIFMQPIVCSLLKTFSFDNHSVFRWLNAPTDAPESAVVALDSPFEKPLLGNWYMLYNRRYTFKLKLENLVRWRTILPTAICLCLPGIGEPRTLRYVKTHLEPIVAVQNLDRYTFQWAYIT